MTICLQGKVWAFNKIEDLQVFVKKRPEERAEVGEDIKMMENLELTVITLNVNGMNSLIKWKQIAEWIRKQNPTICCLQETHMRQVDTHSMKVNGWSKIFWASSEKKKAGVAIEVSDKAK